MNDLLPGHLVDEREGLAQERLGVGRLARVNGLADGLEARPELRSEFAVVRGPLAGLAVSVHRRSMSSRHAGSLSSARQTCPAGPNSWARNTKV